jgi:peptidoglycan hydrolase-like protein with peptidoglycan-binding domain
VPLTAVCTCTCVQVRADQYVRLLQLSLNQLYGKEVIKPDGVYGPRTRTAVESFQELFGMPLHGDVGEQLQVVQRMLRGRADAGGVGPVASRRDGDAGAARDAKAD